MIRNIVNSLKGLVGAWRFELQASCAQGRRAIENNRPVFNVPTETKQLSRDGSMWLAVRKRAHLSVGWAQKLAQSGAAHASASHTRST